MITTQIIAIAQTDGWATTWPGAAVQIILILAVAAIVGIFLWVLSKL